MDEFDNRTYQEKLDMLTGSATRPCASREEFFSATGITSEEDKAPFINFYQELFSITIDYLKHTKYD